MSPFAPQRPCSYPGCTTLTDGSRCDRHRKQERQEYDRRRGYPAARGLGLKTVPCIELDHLTEKQKRAYVIADNKIAQNSLWNDEFLRLELTDLKELGANLELTGFNPMELADITLGKDVEFKEYDEPAADDVQLVTCPKCGHSFPK